MRKLKIVVLIIFLVGCSNNTTYDIVKDLNKAIELGESVVAFPNPNYHKTTFSYYLPSNVSVIESNYNSSGMKLYKEHNITGVRGVVKDGLQVIKDKDPLYHLFLYLCHQCLIVCQIFETQIQYAVFYCYQSHIAHLY